MGRKTPVESSPTRQWAPACRNASLRDEPPNKCCVSAIWFCSAALASSQLLPLSRRRQFQVAPVRGGRGRTKNWQHHFSIQADKTFAHWTQKWKPNGATAAAKWGQKHETMQSWVVCGLSTIEKNDLHNNDKNVWWLRVQPTIHEETWSKETPCQPTFWRKNQVVAVPDMTMTYIRGWLQMVYCHMIYSPKTE